MSKYVNNTKKQHNESPLASAVSFISALKRLQGAAMPVRFVKYDNLLTE